ncbi:MAG: hypothetical protein J0L81_15180 [Caulobacterales bacterium]|jgi:hypothetical protein|nr:hypothetical protein [Caulobacterales bacterium]
MRIAAALIVSAMFLTVPAFANETPAPETPPVEEQAAAPTPEASAAPQEANAEDDADRVICQTVRRSESRLRNRGERICGTRTQWEEMQDRTAREMNRVGSVASGGNQ